MSENNFLLSNPDLYSITFSYSRNLSRGMLSYHEHADYELVVLLSGSGWCYLGTNIFRMEADHMYVIPANCTHMMSYSDHTPHSMYHIYFRPGLLNDIRQKFHIDLEPALLKHSVLYLNEELRFRMDHVLSVTGRKTQLGTIDCAIRHLLVECILLSMARQLGLDSDAPEPAVSHPAIQELIRFIDLHFSEDLTLDILSQHACLNRSYLCRLFRKEVGTTLTEYVNSVRIQNACRLLREGKQNVSQISLESGFNSVAYFERQFHIRIGMTPTVYQNKYRL